jgi:hypothetical protein
MLDADTIADLEGEADLLLRTHGIDRDEPTDMQVLCERITGRRAAFVALATAACSAIVHGERRVFVRRGTPGPRARFLIGHELAHVVHDRAGYVGEDLERRCDALGAALAVPRRAYLRALSIADANIRKLAALLGTTESVAVLREGEVRGRPVAVVRRHGAIVRGDAFVWPVRLELQAAKRVRHVAVLRSAIRDEPDRVGLRAA